MPTPVNIYLIYWASPLPSLVLPLFHANRKQYAPTVIVHFVCVCTLCILSYTLLLTHYFTRGGSKLFLRYVYKKSYHWMPPNLHFCFLSYTFVLISFTLFNFHIFYMMNIRKYMTAVYQYHVI